MPFVYKIHSLAYKENIETYQWYEVQQAGLGLRYLNAVEKSIERIINNPDHFSILRGKYRHVQVKDFPFTIVYEFSQNRKKHTYLCNISQQQEPQEKIQKRRMIFLKYTFSGLLLISLPF